MKRINFTSSDFARLKSTDCLIVDKTRYIYCLLKSGNQFVVNTAPYGFGKSVIVSMQENLFIGRETYLLECMFPILIMISLFIQSLV